MKIFSFSVQYENLSPSTEHFHPPTVCSHKLAWNIAKLAQNSLKFYQTCTENDEMFGILVENSHTTLTSAQELETKKMWKIVRSVILTSCWYLHSTEWGQNSSSYLLCGKHFHLSSFSPHLVSLQDFL